MQTDVLHKQAIDYGKIGWAILPLRPKDKRPLIKQWPETSTNNIKQIYKWWNIWPDANIGIVTGKKSGIVVIDVDIKNGGDWTLDALETFYGKLPETLISRTGTGGKHLIFKYPDMPIGNSSCKIGLGLDVRGDGGYIVAPPSIHPCGTKYMWLNMNGKGPHLATMPEWMLEKLAKKDYAIDTTMSEEDIEPPDPVTGEIFLKKAFYKLMNGEPRNFTAFWLACQLRDLGFRIEDAQTLILLFQQQAPSKDHPFTEEEVIKTLNSAYQGKRRKKPGIDYETYAG